MTETNFIGQILTAYRLEHSLIAEELNDEDFFELCSIFGIEAGERFFAYFSNAPTKISFKDGVVLTDRRVIWGKENVFKEIVECQSFSHEDLKFVLDDIDIGTLSAKVKLPDGRYFEIFHKGSKFLKLLSKLYPVLESDDGSFGVTVTSDLSEKAQARNEHVKEEVKERRATEIAGNMKFFKSLLLWGGIPLAILFMFSMAGTATKSVDKGSFSDRDICRAGISNVMGRPLSIIRVYGSQSDYYKLTYTRRLDNSRWNFRCKIEGDQVVWSSEKGPWRTRSGDAPVYWSVSGGGNTLTLRETYGDGSINKDVYYKKDF